jgi:hypothetical protein
MIKTKLIILFFAGLSFFASCDKGEDIDSPSLWQLTDEFSQYEKSLFDSLDFNNTADYEHEETGYIQPRPQIVFSPNPFDDIAYLSYSSNLTKPIINVVILSENTEDVLEIRVESSTVIGFNFSDKPSGIYRLYYVIQDSTYSIVHLGHGNIRKQ